MSAQLAALLGPSPGAARSLSGVSGEGWRRFAHACTIAEKDEPNAGQPRQFHVVSPWGGFGSFDLRPKRLEDLGLMTHVRPERVNGRQIHIGEFIADADLAALGLGEIFRGPLTRERFLRAPLLQNLVFFESIRRYDEEIRKALPADVSRSGALAILHRTGPNGLASWTKRKLENTVALFQRANNLF